MSESTISIKCNNIVSQNNPPAERQRSANTTFDNLVIDSNKTSKTIKSGQEQQPLNLLQSLSIPPPPAAFQINPRLNPSAPIFTPNESHSPLDGQIETAQKAVQESLAKLQVLSLQLNALSMLNQQNQSIQTLNQYTLIYNQYQLEFTHSLVVNQYLSNLNNLKLNEAKNAVPTPSKHKKQKLETIEEGEDEEHAMSEDEMEGSLETKTKKGEQLETNTTSDGEPHSTQNRNVSELEKIKKQIRGILNKITPENFAKLSQEIASILKIADITDSAQGHNALNAEQLRVAQKAQFKCLIKLILKCILEKAVNEHLFSNQYARLCYSLYLYAESNELKKKLFRQQLLSLTHSVFKKARNNQESTRFIGIITMIGELFTYGLISWNVIFSGIFEELLPPKSALDIEAICKLLKISGNNFDRHHYKEINSVLQRLSKYAENYEFRIQCLVKEIDEMRRNDWTQKIKKEQPMTLNQVHREFHSKTKQKSPSNDNNQHHHHRVSQQTPSPQRWRNNNHYHRPQRWRNNGYNSHRNGYKGRKQKSIRPTVEFVKDVTLPDRSHYPSNKILTKTWAMRNSGELQWGDNVELVYFKGDETLSLQQRYPVKNAKAGEEVLISATIRTPNQPGRYCTYFRLQKNGKFFGPRVWVDIIVNAQNSLIINQQ